MLAGRGLHVFFHQSALGCSFYWTLWFFVVWFYWSFKETCSGEWCWWIDWLDDSFTPWPNQHLVSLRHPKLSFTLTTCFTQLPNKNMRTDSFSDSLSDSLRTEIKSAISKDHPSLLVYKTPTDYPKSKLQGPSKGHCTDKQQELPQSNKLSSDTRPTLSSFQKPQENFPLTVFLLFS